ncbi:hypothetical protein [Spirosoma sp.]|uniref:hypothetical protein n=1 Tax=Spirosoma sp. TaxID=1899569 RepID=UPI0026185AAC|nr:hypothetical protein [Spirosoma sp.]MCX6213021.1 hypothetical protein [Spirosoma sp.]
MRCYVVIEQKVKSYDGLFVTLSNGNTNAARTLFWTAGVEGVIISGLAPTSIGKGNRNSVNAFIQVDGYENVFLLAIVGRNDFHKVSRSGT